MQSKKMAGDGTMDALQRGWIDADNCASVLALSRRDPAVKQRVVAQIEAFEEALDEVDSGPSADARDRLHEAADGLMRAIAAVMLELGKQPSG
jgi:hypothetical protein